MKTCSPKISLSGSPGIGNVLETKFAADDLVSCLSQAETYQSYALFQ